MPLSQWCHLLCLLVQVCTRLALSSVSIDSSILLLDRTGQELYHLCARFRSRRLHDPPFGKVKCNQARVQANTLFARGSLQLFQDSTWPHWQVILPDTSTSHWGRHCQKGHHWTSQRHRPLCIELHRFEAHLNCQLSSHIGTESWTDERRMESHTHARAYLHRVVWTTSFHSHQELILRGNFCWLSLLQQRLQSQECGW